MDLSFEFRVEFFKTQSISERKMCILFKRNLPGVWGVWTLQVALSGSRSQFKQTVVRYFKATENTEDGKMPKGCHGGKKRKGKKGKKGKK